MPEFDRPTSTFIMDFPAAKILENARYYSFGFLGSDDGELNVDLFAHWAGWADDAKAIELRG